MEPLVVTVEDTASRVVVEYVFSRSPVRVGRSSRNDLAVPLPFVSAWHGVIEFDGAAVRYTDLGSMNGSIVGGASVPPGVAVPLEPGTDICIGTLRLTPSTGASERASAIAESSISTQASDSGIAPVRPGRITELMEQVARAAPPALDEVWRRAFLPGSRVGRFELVREIGRGAFGVVFEARDCQLGRSVAFKAVRPGRGSQVRFREERLQQEAEAIAQLSHPNIVTLYDAGTCESGPYLVFELLSGETLRQRMGRGTLGAGEALDIAIDVAWALDHAHRAQVAHRDLKPANVFLCEDARVKVLDFGIARVFGVEDERSAGTPPYMAPEQWRGGRQDARTDVFGAAAMLFETMTGLLPYPCTAEWSAVLEPGYRPVLDVPGLPSDLKQLLESALSPDPAARPADGRAWLGALLAIRERGSRAERLTPAARGAPRAGAGGSGTDPATRQRVRAAAIAAACVGAAALGALAYCLLGR